MHILFVYVQALFAVYAYQEKLIVLVSLNKEGQGLHGKSALLNLFAMVC